MERRHPAPAEPPQAEENESGGRKSDPSEQRLLSHRKNL